MFEFHKDRKRYFDIQVLNAQQHVLPFIEKAFPITTGMRVLEIGCGEGGVLKAFVNQGCVGVGVELDELRLINAREWLADDIAAGKISFISKDIYQVDPYTELNGLFDIIVLKDVIEHIHDQPKLIAWMKTFLKPAGVIFFGFPPWQMPFGGHQQMNSNKWLSKLPYYHLLPRPLYKWLLQKGNGPVDELLEVRDTRISIEKFERIAIETGYTIIHKLHFLVNPIYEWKFGWKAKPQFKLIEAIPYLRNYFTTCVYYLIQQNKI
jgi:SAM-dependent methyltransferase